MRLADKVDALIAKYGPDVVGPAAPVGELELARKRDAFVELARTTGFRSRWLRAFDTEDPTMYCALQGANIPLHDPSGWYMFLDDERDISYVGLDPKRGEIGRNTPMLITRVDREKLKGIVRDYMKGDVFFSVEVQDPNLLGMVFLPVMLGGLSYPVMCPEGTEKPVAPVRPVRPVMGVVDTGKEGAKLTEEIKSIRESIAQTEFRVRWDEAPEEELQSLRDTLIRTQAEHDALVASITAGMKRDLRIRLSDYLVDLKEYRKARTAWRALVKDWEEGEEGLRNRVAAWEKSRDEWNKSITEDLGVLYAYMKDAGPRAVNGYPVFFSCSYLHKKDWELVRNGIAKEIERQKDIDLGDGE